MEDGELLEKQTIAALKAYYEAQGNNCPACELEKLRLEAEFAFQTLSDYQLMLLGYQTPTRH